MPLAAGMPAFPGDPVFASRPVRELARGAPYNLSALELGSHTGTHVDPPRHFLPHGASVDRIDLGLLNGPCSVVQVPEGRTVIRAEDLGSITGSPGRVLFRTENSRRWARRLEFFPDYVGLDLTAARSLADRGVRLIGLDALSIERDPTATYPVHRLLLGAGVVILEGLLLDGVEAGPAELHCLPLRLADGDGGPARVALCRP